MVKKSLIVYVLLSYFFASHTFAHVVVKPKEVGVATYQIFSVGVPVEKSSATVGLRLVIPSGLESVSPNVKSGWKININKSEVDGKSKVTEIEWSGGQIPEGQRDDFIFSAKTPSDPTVLRWKAYQTYQDGTVVSWENEADMQPKDSTGIPDFSKSGPYSETKVIDDLSVKKSDNLQMVFFGISLISLILSVFAIRYSRQRNNI